MNNQVLFPAPDPKMFTGGRGRSTPFDEGIERKDWRKIIDTSRGNNGYEISETEGFLVYHRSFEQPEKGWRDEYAVQATAYTKRMFISQVRLFASKPLLPILGFFLLLPWRIKIKIIEQWLHEFSVFSWILMKEYYLEEKYLTKFTRQIIKGTAIFLKELGIAENHAINFAKTFGAFMEYDTAYRYRGEDLFTALFSEMTLEEVLKDPRKAVKRILEILSERDARIDLNIKFKSLGTLLSYALLLPKVKKAFKKALTEIDVKALQLDKIDLYHVRHMADYNFLGMTFEERIAKWPLEPHTYIELIYDEQNKTQ